jgi:acyl transferase domain-containing protein
MSTEPDITAADGGGAEGARAAEHQRLRDYLKRVTIDLHDARTRLRTLEAQAHEPIAIVGMSCRYPGGIRSPDDLWRVASGGEDTIGPFPTDRGWDLDRLLNSDPDDPGPTYTGEGGFVEDVAEFDADFFSISPREALTMDPQQRLLLEASWELLEHAGIDPTELRRSSTGVYVGGANLGYGLGADGALLSASAGSAGTGALASVLSGRIAYTFGLEGPALTIDTGCSSSLVALHLACEALRRRECTLALAGGVAVISSPGAFQEFARQRALAPDGRCKSYADVADGTGWSEGVGMLLVERLADAERHGHRVWAVVRGSAINQDGASNGLSAPNGRAQQQVMRTALANAKVSADSVDVVEGHGTGTTLGDPIEASALLATYGRGRAPEWPLWLGSIKSNLGHTQAAGGVAGVIKMVMALVHQELPRTLHVDAPSSQIDWAAGSVSLLTETRDWPQGEEPRRAGVSSFGVSGTNAHVILEQSPPREEPCSAAESHPSGLSVSAPMPCVLSAKGEAALRGYAGRLHDRLVEETAPRAVDVCFSLTSRAALRERAVILGEDARQLCAGLSALSEGRDVPRLVQGSVGPRRPGMAFLFTGQGAQRVGMGRELYESYPPFRDALEEVCGCFDRLLDRSLLEVMLGNGVASPEAQVRAELDRTALTQPALFALEVALFRLLERWGLEPDFVLGHSVGELAAVHVSGALSLKDACTLTAARGRLMGALPEGGAMVALQASERQAAELVGEYAEAVSIAAVNGPSSVVISGEEKEVLELSDRWERLGRKIKRLTVSHAFHSARMEGMLDELAELAGELAFADPRIPIVSNVDGERLTAERLCDRTYWAIQARQTVRFADGVRWLLEHGVRSFLELGPDGVLSAMVSDCAAGIAAQASDAHGEDTETGEHTDIAGAREDEALAVPLLRRDRPEASTLIEAIARAWVAGARVDWRALYTGSGAKRVQLPTYAFQRRRYWLEASASVDVATDQFDEAQVAAVEGAQPAGQELRDRLRRAASEERGGLLLDTVRREVARIVGHDAPEAVGPGRTFKDLGFDSLMAVELRRRLERATGLTLPNTLAFNHPTSTAIAEHLQGCLSESPAVGGREPALGPSGRARGSQGMREPVAHEPIAIVGMSCRYPGGAHSPEQLWQLVVEGTDAISKFPTDRGWDLETIYDPDPETPGTTYTDEGGFVHDAAQFDAGFFGIGEREALMMDPQQRLFLEVSWEAIERSGLDPTSLRGSRTGVFAGVAGQDYGAYAARDARDDDQLAYLGLGTSASVLSGRFAHLLDLHGPTFTVDAACASSLVALHVACESLRKGECELALAGGVTVLSTPLMVIVMSRQRGLARDGRCKSFADAADGMGFAEGAGMVALERLDDARRHGHRVLAVISGSAVNQDGMSNGLMAPNGHAQEEVIRQALANADLTPSQVDAVEGHGTGTRLGDPIEAEAIIATYGRERPAGRPLWLGSVKSNIGHTQAAAGVAGVIKMVMAMQQRLLPQTLHVNAPSSQVNWALGDVSLLTEAIAWPSAEQPMRAAVSAFGASGTNAHLILAEACGKPAPNEGAPSIVATQQAQAPGKPFQAVFADDTSTPWIISGRTQAALRAQAASLHEWASESANVRLREVARSLATARPALECRAAVVGDTDEQLMAGLRAVVAGEPASGVVTSAAESGNGQVVFVFPGQGSQWAGMASELLEDSPLFAEHIQVCERALEAHTGWLLTDVLRGSADAPSLDRIDVLQPVLFSLMVSLAGLWRACGVRPAAVVGHSQGEIAAVHVAGGLSLEDAAGLVARRSRVLRDVAGTGEMASIGLGERELSALLESWEGRIFIAACNGPGSTVVSGESEALQELLTECAARKVRARPVAGVLGAGHSPHMEPLRERLLESASLLEPRASEVAFYSTVTADRLDTAELGDEYWYRNARDPVQFDGAIRRLLAGGFRMFVEVSPHPILSYALAEIAEHDECGVSGVRVAPTLRRGEGGARRFLASLGGAWTDGASVDWKATLGGGHPETFSLPTYAFQRKRYWAEGAMRSDATAMRVLDRNGNDHSAVAERLPDPELSTLGRRLSAAEPSGRMQIVVQAVSDQVSAMLGDAAPETIAPGMSLLELGFDSTMALELRMRLGAISGLRIPASVIFEQPTPEAIAVYIEGRVAGLSPSSTESRRGLPVGLQGRVSAPDDVPAQGGSPGALVQMLRAALERGTQDRFLDLLKAASEFHPTFDLAGACGVGSKTVKLCDGDASIGLICVPTALALSGPHQYVRFARAFAGARAVSAVSLPGFGPGEPAPADLDAAVEALAVELERKCKDARYALVGYSSGGWLANALASRLERDGEGTATPAAVVLLDVLDPSAVSSGSVGALLGEHEGMLAQEMLSLASDGRLAAMGSYLRLLSDWRPLAIDAPTLVVRAREQPRSSSLEIGADSEIEVAGDHFTIIDERVEGTVRSVEAWLERRCEVDKTTTQGEVSHAC